MEDRNFLHTLPNALGREPIEMRRNDLLIAVAAEVAVALIIRNDEQDVGRPPGLWCCGERPHP